MGRRTTTGLAAAAMLGLCACGKPPTQPEASVAERARVAPGLTAGGLGDGTGEAGERLAVNYQWPLYVARTGQRARETAVGFVRPDGSPGGVMIVNAEGAMIQTIPGTTGPDARAVAERWLKARGWALK